MNQILGFASDLNHLRLCVLQLNARQGEKAVINGPNLNCFVYKTKQIKSRENGAQKDKAFAVQAVQAARECVRCFSFRQEIATKIKCQIVELKLSVFPKTSSCTSQQFQNKKLHFPVKHCTLKKDPSVIRIHLNSEQTSQV